MSTQETRIRIGDGQVTMSIESWAQLPVEVRQTARKLGSELLAVLAPHQVSYIQIAGKPEALRK